MLKRGCSLAEQVKCHLRQQIVRGEFETGRIPPELDLANALIVSRDTIRDALSRLEWEGIIIRKQGVGTFVNEAYLHIKFPLGEVRSYEAMLEAHGYSPSTQVIDVEEQPATPRLAAELNLKLDDNLLVIQKLLLIDRKPVIFNRINVPTRIINQPYTYNGLNLPLHRFLSEYCREHLTHYLSELVPLIPSAWLVKILNLAHQETAILSFEEIGYNQDNRPIVKVHSYFENTLPKWQMLRKSP
ncbi:MAG: GntR family transcriptional regulator [Chloroflexota bacterium]|nr:MAG: GntR family transcriptional regulator [Chloroflexota bacterium]